MLAYFKVEGFGYFAEETDLNAIAFGKTPEEARKGLADWLWEKGKDVPSVLKGEQ